jgi:hypothetical protein
MLQKLSRLIQGSIKQNNTGSAIQIAGNVNNSTVVQNNYMDIPALFDHALSHNNHLDQIPYTYYEPPLPANHIVRYNDVEQIKKLLSESPIVVLYGGRYKGKTILSLLLSSLLGHQLHYLPILGQYSFIHAVDSYGKRLNKKFNIATMKGFSPLIKKNNTLLVIDNLPATLPTEIEINVLNDLIAAHVKAGNLICINALTSNLNPKFNLSSAHYYQIPPISYEDIARSLESKGNSQFARLIANITNGNPVLVKTLIEYLEKSNWDFGNIQTIENVIREKYASNSIDYVRKEFIEDTVDEDARNLIYKLDLLLEPISMNTISQISELPPVTSNLDKVLLQVAGIWLDQKQDLFSINPLIKKMGEKYISDSDKRQIWQNRVQNINRARGKRIDSLTSNSIVTYAIKLDDFNLLLSECFIATLALLDASESVFYMVADDFLLRSLWASKSMPEFVPISTQAQIRFFQLCISERLGKDSTFLRDDLIRLLDLPSDFDFMSVMSILGLLIKTNNLDARLYLRIVNIAHLNIDRVQAVVDDQNNKLYSANLRDSILELSGSTDILDMLINYFWLSSLNFSLEQFNDVFTSASTFSIVMKSKLFKSSVFEELVFSIFEAVYLRLFESKRTKDEIQYCLSVLERAKSISDEIESTSMRIAIVKNELIIHGEELGDIDKVTVIYSELVQKKPELDSKSKYYLDSTYASQLYLANLGKAQDDFASLLFENAFNSYVPDKNNTNVIDLYFKIKQLAHLISRSHLYDKTAYIADRIKLIQGNAYLKNEMKIDCFQILAALYLYQSKVIEAVKELSEGFLYGLKKLSFDPTLYDAVEKSILIRVTLYIKSIWIGEASKSDQLELNDETRGLPLTFENLWYNYPQLHQAWSYDYLITSVTLLVVLFNMLSDRELAYIWICLFYRLYLNNREHIHNLDYLYRSHRQYLIAIIENAKYASIKEQLTSVKNSNSGLVTEAEQVAVLLGVASDN